MIYIAAIVIFVIIAAYLARYSWLSRDTSTSKEWKSQFTMGVSTEMVGAAISTLLVTFAADYVLQQLPIAQTERRDELIEQLYNSSNDEEQLTTIATLRDERFLTNGSLNNLTLVGLELDNVDLAEGDFVGVDFSDSVITNTDLSSANLNAANFQNVNLAGTDFSNASLLSTNFQDAILFNVVFDEANLRNANFTLSIFDSDENNDLFNGANLTGANLANLDLSNMRFEDTTLRNADLSITDLDGVDFTSKDLTGVDLADAILGSATFDEDTILPDGTPYTTDTDMGRFTSPTHPNFWRSSDPNSPAYRD